MTKKKVDDLFFQLFCEKKSDGTQHLRLRGKEIFQRFGFRLDVDNMHELVVFLRRNKEVNSLDLAYNKIGDAGLKVLVHYYFKDKNCMKYLNLLHCDIGPEGLKWLADSNCLDLKSLRLEGNKFGPNGAQFIGKILDRCQDLEDLDIGETDQTNQSIEAVLIVIEKSSLKSLNISRIIPKTYYSKYNTSVLAADLGILLKLNPSLEVLRVQKCEFDGHDIELLVAGLRCHRNLMLLDLGANRFGDLGVMFIAQWLRTRPSLVGLRLPANNITTTGAETLGISLPFSRIRLLDLQYNRIGCTGILKLLHSIKKSTPMRMLFIWGNEIGPKELDALDKLINAGVLDQECVDIKIYTVDGVKKAAYYSTNKYTQEAYSISEYGFPPALKIIRKKVVNPTDSPRALINFDFINRYPPAGKKESCECSLDGLEQEEKHKSFDEDQNRLFV